MTGVTNLIQNNHEPKSFLHTTEFLGQNIKGGKFNIVKIVLPRLFKCHLIEKIKKKFY